MKCSECQKKMSDHLDQTLSLHEQRLMKRHLEECEQCREAMGSLQLTRALLQGIQEEPLPAAFDRRMKHALFQQNLKHDIGPNVVSAFVIARQGSNRRSWSSKENGKRRWKTATSLVAVCTLGIGILILSNNLLVPVTTPEPEASKRMTMMVQEDASAPAMMKMVEPEAAIAKPKVLYADYADQIEQKLLGYQYKVINFDETTGRGKLLIIKDQSGTLINRELEILCQAGRIQIDDNWPGL